MSGRKPGKEVSIARSSAAEYLTFVAATGDQSQSVEMRYEDENIWLTQKMMATLYGVTVAAINQHLKRIFDDGELARDADRQDGRCHCQELLSTEEMAFLERIVSLYLDFGELQAMRRIPMAMEDCARRLDGFLEFNGSEIRPRRAGFRPSRPSCTSKPSSRNTIVQDRLFESDFDRFIALEAGTKKLGKVKGKEKP